MRTLVLGASLKKERYSNQAVRRLREYNHEVVAHGLREGHVGDVEIRTSLEGIENIHTVTVYLGARNQDDFIAFVLELKPKRVIFNPGAENPKFAQLLDQAGISHEEACTLVLLSTNQY